MICYGSKSFASAAAIHWNQLPKSVKSCDTVTHFKRSHKTHIFSLHYNLMYILINHTCIYVKYLPCKAFWALTCWYLAGKALYKYINIIILPLTHLSAQYYCTYRHPSIVHWTMMYIQWLHMIAYRGHNKKLSIFKQNLSMAGNVEFKDYSEWNTAMQLRLKCRVFLRDIRGSNPRSGLAVWSFHPRAITDHPMRMIFLNY